MEMIDVAVVGGGQAGLATSRELALRGIEHVVLERDRIGRSWRGRWDSFCLVTPNWSVQLPGAPYAGDDPDGFMPRDDIVTYLEAYARAAALPVREGVAVDAVRRDDGVFVLDSSHGDIRARVVVLATGAYQRPHRPRGAAALPADLLAIDVETYRNPSALPPGPILVVGSGQSGCQIAEELRLAGRDVILSCGRAAWAPRRIGDRDLFWWAVQTGFTRQPVDALPAPGARLLANVVATGRDGGHDLHLRTLRALGVTLVGRFAGVDGNTAHFDDDLLETVAWGDERFRLLVEDIPPTARALGLPAPEIPEPAPFGDRGPLEVDLTGFGAAIFTSGFRPDYGALAPWPEAFDEMGFPIQRDGASEAIPGLSFIGVHFLRTRQSSLLLGVGEDAAVVADEIARRLDGVSRGP